MGSTERRRQQRRDKQARKRARAKQEASKREEPLPRSPAGLIKLAARSPFGPSWASVGLRGAHGADGSADEEAPPPLVTVVVTRKIGHGLLLPHVALVDRTCLGVKNAMVMSPATTAEMDDRVALMSEDEPLERCEVAVAQSVVFYAVDYARSLGFEPHADFEPSLWLPRPEPLVETPLSRPARPFYIQGPDDDVARILRRLDAAVGRGNYDMILVSPGPGLFDSGELFDDDDDDDDDDAEDWLPDSRPSDAEGPAEPPPEGDIDWQLAVRGVPTDDVLEECDLDTASGRTEAVEAMIEMLEEDRFLAWEGIIREEQGLPLSAAQTDALDELFSFWDEGDEDDERVLTIDDLGRPPEPWYATLRRLAPRLVLDRYVTWEPSYHEAETAGARLLEAVERHGRRLSLPAGCSKPRDVLEPRLWHRLELQALFELADGLGEDLDGEVVSLSHPTWRSMLDVFLEGIEAYAENMDALGWTLDDLLQVLILPDKDRALVLAAARRRGLC